MYNISALLFPNRCICCGKICTDRFFCKHCAGSLSMITKKLCDRCGLPVSLCCCKQNFYYFRSVISCFENDGEARQAFYRFKFGGYRPAARYFTDAMAAQVERLYDGITFDFVSAVPTHRKTVRERGYDQTRLLAKQLARRLDLPFSEMLYQPKLTPKQHLAAGVQARFDNIRGKYRLRRGISAAGKTVLLVDDIKTTGATLSECARELKLAGAEEVYCVTALSTFPRPRELTGKMPPDRKMDQSSGCF